MNQQTTQPVTPGVNPFVPLVPHPNEMPAFEGESCPSPFEPTGCYKVVLYNVSWSTYEAILRDVDNPGTRFAYDNGTLIIMSPSRRHEFIKSLLRRMVEITCEEFDIDISSGGATTHKEERIKKGFEPDECFFIEHEAAMEGRDEWIAGVDPPPDLAIEVDIYSTSDEKLPIYAAFGIPEVWHWQSERLHVLRLQADGTYTEQATSAALPVANVQLIEKIASRRRTKESKLLKEFRVATQEMKRA